MNHNQPDLVEKDCTETQGLSDDVVVACLHQAPFEPNRVEHLFGTDSALWTGSLVDSVKGRRPYRQVRSAA
jgi:hypothetical protein